MHDTTSDGLFARNPGYCTTEAQSGRHFRLSFWHKALQRLLFWADCSLSPKKCFPHLEICHVFGAGKRYVASNVL